jgi:6-phosphofructokinase 2
LGIRAHPFLVKPNIAEAELLLGRPLRDQAAVVSGAQEIAAMGVEIVVVSRGAQGAICVQGDHVWQAIPPSVKRQSTIGSGDSMVAGLVVALAGGQSLEDALRLGTAAGAATAIFPGTSLGSATDVARLLPLVKVERLS